MITRIPLRFNHILLIVSIIGSLLCCLVLIIYDCVVSIAWICQTMIETWILIFSNTSFFWIFLNLHYFLGWITNICCIFFPSGEHGFDCDHTNDPNNVHIKCIIFVFMINSKGLTSMPRTSSAEIDYCYLLIHRKFLLHSANIYFTAIWCSFPWATIELTIINGPTISTLNKT